MNPTAFVAMAPPPQGGGPSAGSAMVMNLVFIGLIMLIFYFLLIRPQQQRQKKHQQMIETLRKGDRILTSGGLYCTVLNVKDDRIVATIGEDVKIEIAKAYVAAVVARE